MRKYVIKRFLLFIPSLLIVSVAVFAIIRIIPGDVAAAILTAGDEGASFTEEARQLVVKELGLDRPIYIQYVEWMWGLVRFDPGESWVLKKPIFEEMKRQFPVTLQLTAFSIILVSAIAIPIGILAAVYQDKWPDYILRTIAIAGLAMPSFFVGLLVVIGLSVLLHWLPPPGFANLWESPWKSFQQLIFPAAALALSSSGVMLRMTRAQMLEVLRDDYVRTARAKGLPERVIILRHALRNALLPVITVLGFQIAVLLGGTVTTEIIFSIPGLGVNLIEAVISKDLPVVQAYVMYLAFIALLANLIVDLSYAILDPRIQYE